MSRRELMKKAGVVGAATVVATPIVQSVAAPAWATVTCANPSDTAQHCGGDCTAKCPQNGMCVSGADCASGACTNGKCTVPNGQTCSGTSQLTRDQSCTSQYCGGNTDTSTCTTPPTGGGNGTVCHGGTKAVADAECSTGLSCSGWTSVTGAGTCTVLPGQTLPNGAVCIGTDQASRDASCTSGYCNGNTATSTCQPAPTVAGGQDATCHGATQTIANQQCDSAHYVCQTSSGKCKLKSGESCGSGTPTDKAKCASGTCTSGGTKVCT